MSIPEAIILGILQGITEFLPVSSSGHIELGKAIFNITSADNLAFTILVHGATVLSILVVLRREIWQLLRALFRFEWNEETQYLAKLAVSMVPVGIVGLFFEDAIAQLFNGRVVMVGCFLIGTGFILQLSRLDRGQNKPVGFTQAIIIGLAQAVAILPGISRSGTTIATALALGVAKPQATRFSFLMVLAPIMGATLLKMKDLEHEAATTTDLLPYAIGFLTAFVSGAIACRWMLNLVQGGKITWFSVYCFAIGLIAIVSGLWTQ
ncbi:undecaprenyl-diphosphate phosphatase [Sphingobacteriales bacterium UPWRP_1]|nr:UDP-diphosphatase [Sphingobacteriales bacterium TSM_CSM]PSJ76551.1 undecaprenyl-diphosphate phosphatase [Sphingobacteriales bacterium UPWRP_1]